MNQFLKNIFLYGFILLLAVQTLNLSVNSIGFYNTISSATDNEDYVDSMVEYVVENVLGYSKDTIHDKANVDYASKQQQAPVHFDLKWYPSDVSISYLNEAINKIITIVPRNEQFANLYFKEVPCKPPQFLFA